MWSTERRINRHDLATEYQLQSYGSNEPIQWKPFVVANGSHGQVSSTRKKELNKIKLKTIKQLIEKIKSSIVSLLSVPRVSRSRLRAEIVFSDIVRTVHKVQIN